MTLAFQHSKNKDQRVYNRPTCVGVNEVAGLLVESLNKHAMPRMLCVHLHDTGPETVIHIPVTSAIADPLTYPIFFPSGDYGYIEDSPPWEPEFPPDVVPDRRAHNRNRENERPQFVDDEAVDEDAHDDEAPQAPRNKRAKKLSL